MQTEKITKAEKLFDKGKMTKSLTLYEKEIRRWFRVYRPELVEYQWNRNSKKPKVGSKSLTRKLNKSSPEQVNISIPQSIEEESQANYASAEKKGDETIQSNNFSGNGEEFTSVKPEHQQLLEKVIIDFNKVGMQFLSLGQIEEAKGILKTLVALCREFANQDQKLVWLTFNNVSWIHKKLNEFKIAMKLLKRAQSIAEDGCSEDYLALTYINLSAIFSELKQ